MDAELHGWAYLLMAAGPAITGLATVVIAGIVAWITFAQSKTAREKLVLDLFKDRVSVLTKVDNALRLVMGPGRPVDNEPFSLLHEARGEAHFLFGEEVEQHIKSLLDDVISLGLAADMLRARREGDDDGRQDWPQVRHDAMIRVSEGASKLAELMAPYTKFTQRLPGQ